MDILNLVNFYIIYIYILLAIIILILLIILFKNIKPLKKGFGVVSLYIDSFKKKTDNIQKAKEKVDYTLNNTLPVVGFVAISIGVFVKAIKENHKNKNGFLKNTIKGYTRINKYLKPTPTTKYIKVVISKLSKMV